MIEPEILKKLNHPNLPRIVDVIKIHEGIYIIEDYFEGQSLQHVLTDRQRCTEANVVRWSQQMAEILIYLHSLNLPPSFIVI